jgi:hypothetical protein
LPQRTASFWSKRFEFGIRVMKNWSLVTKF